MAAHTHGRFVWRAHVSADPAASQGFYAALFGWTFAPPPGEKRPHSVARVGATPVCGFSTASTPAVRPHWSTYLSMEDVDGAAAIAAISGGRVVAPPMDVSGLGRCALIADPQGATVQLLRGAEGDPPLPARPAAFTFGWEALHTTDRAGALGFYGRLAPWHVGELRGQTLLVAGSGTTADVQVAKPGLPSLWVPFVAVPDLTDRRRAATELGARVRVEEAPVWGVGRALTIEDPFGAVIGLFEPAA
jgi:predicted enzyme related to lactoylglutathione lyase